MALASRAMYTHSGGASGTLLLWVLHTQATVFLQRCAFAGFAVTHKGFWSRVSDEVGSFRLPSPLVWPAEASQR